MMMTAISLRVMRVYIEYFTHRCSFSLPFHIRAMTEFHAIRHSDSEFLMPADFAITAQYITRFNASISRLGK